MKTKNIIKTLALAMLMPATLLTTACSSDDVIVNNENTAKKGYPLQVTVNVSREGDEGTTRATYNYETNTLGFSTGDKLFVIGVSTGTKQYAGTLDYVANGTFTGTIYSEVEYSGTADDFLKKAESAEAVLLPEGYEGYGYLTITGTGYSANVAIDATKAIATTKKAAVEQLSFESANSYSNGFALTPKNAILNFTITGLTPNTNVNATLSSGSSFTISGEVTVDASGTASFAMGVMSGIDLNGLTLTVGDNAITLPSSGTVAAGKIYNITRSAAQQTETQSSFDISGHTFYYNSGENWGQAINTHSSQNTGWSIKDLDGLNCIVVYNDQWVYDYAGNLQLNGSSIFPGNNYYLAAPAKTLVIEGYTLYYKGDETTWGGVFNTSSYLFLNEYEGWVCSEIEEKQVICAYDEDWQPVPLKYKSGDKSGQYVYEDDAFVPNADLYTFE